MRPMILLDHPIWLFGLKLKVGEAQLGVLKRFALASLRHRMCSVWSGGAHGLCRAKPSKRALLGSSKKQKGGPGHV